MGGREGKGKERGGRGGCKRKGERGREEGGKRGRGRYEGGGREKKQRGRGAGADTHFDLARKRKKNR